MNDFISAITTYKSDINWRNSFPKEHADSIDAEISRYYAKYDELIPHLRFFNEKTREYRVDHKYNDVEYLYRSSANIACNILLESMKGCFHTIENICSKALGVKVFSIPQGMTIYDRIDIDKVMNQRFGNDEQLFEQVTLSCRGELSRYASLESETEKSLKFSRVYVIEYNGGGYGSSYENFRSWFPKLMENFAKNISQCYSNRKDETECIGYYDRIKLNRKYMAVYHNLNGAHLPVVSFKANADNRLELIFDYASDLKTFKQLYLI